MSISLNHLYPGALRPITQLLNEDGDAIVFVTLACGRRAFLDADDFHRIIAQGFSPQWALTDNGSGTSYVRVTVPPDFDWASHSVPISRLIMAPPFRGIVVRHHDGDRLNLRRKNLVTRWGRTPALARERFIEDPLPGSAAA